MNFLVVRYYVQLLQRALGVARGVDGLAMRRFACAGCFAPLGFLFLNVRAVEQHHLQQITGGSGGVNRAGEAFGNQSRQQAGVINVRMRKQHKCNVVRLEAKRLVILICGFAPALEHAAVNQELRAVRLNAVARTSYARYAAVESEFHGVSNSSVRAVSNAISSALITYGGMKYTVLPAVLLIGRSSNSFESAA